MAWVRCQKCGKLDKSDKTKMPHVVGTKTIMVCPDCADDNGKASFCRDCCPTGHATRGEL